MTGVASTNADEVNAVDAVTAIQQVAPAAISGVVTASGDADSAVRARLADGATVTVPVDPAEGVLVAGAGTAPDVRIGLPFAGRASQAAASQMQGVVVYDNNNGSSTVPVAHTDGRVQITTVIENKDAPKRYDYAIQAGTGTRLRVNDDGSATLSDQAGVPLVGVAAPWAKDANGANVSTHFEVDGQTLVQVVDFSEETAFPVVADPTASYYSYNCVLQNGSSYFLAPGAKLSTCKGSRLQKYINGRMVQTIALTGYGYPGNPAAFGTLDCVVAILGAAASVYGIGGAVVLTAKGAVAWLGLGTSVYGLKSCTG
ncbi:hypothetical protein [Leifsonia xyli]|uniref:hypothetical protein n=1 Tax=Leifsonia xyli TaxID=1575 RepID=UPI003D676518